MAAKKKVMLGMQVVDIVSGYEGVATAKTEFLNGCMRICISPPADKKTGELKEGVWFDQEQLKVKEANTPARKLVLRRENSSSLTTGGTRPDAQRAADAKR